MGRRKGGRKLTCKHGSYTCGLLTKLYPNNKTQRCNSCKNESDGVPDCVIDGICPLNVKEVE